MRPNRGSASQDDEGGEARFRLGLGGGDCGNGEETKGRVAACCEEEGEGEGEGDGEGEGGKSEGEGREEGETEAEAEAEGKGPTKKRGRCGERG